jgi:hypothetical protein
MLMGPNQRAGPGDEGKGQRKHRDVRPPPALGLLVGGSPGARLARKHHLEREQEQQQPAEDTEGLQADAHQLEECCTAQRKQQQNAGSHHHRLRRHATLIGDTRALRQPAEQRNERDRLHHDEEHDEKFQRLLEHGTFATRKRGGK